MANPDRGPGAPLRRPKPVTAEACWYIFKYINAVSAEDPKASFIAGFNRAYRDSVVDQTDFVDLLPLLRRLLDLLEHLSVERDVVRSIAEGEVEV